MPLRKYRSIDQVPAPPAGRPLDPENLKRAFELMELGARLSRARYPPGVRRFRTLGEANRHREALEAALLRPTDAGQSDTEPRG